MSRYDLFIHIVAAGKDSGSYARLLPVLVACASILAFPLPLRGQPQAPNPINDACSKAAAAKELGAAARQRFLDNCTRTTRTDDNLNPGGLPSDSPEASKLSPQEKERLEHCLGVAAGRSLQGASRQRFLHDCLSP